LIGWLVSEEIIQKQFLVKHRVQLSGSLYTTSITVKI